MSNQIIPEGLVPLDDEANPAPMDGTFITVWRQGYGLYSVRWRNGKWTMKTGRVIPADEITGSRPTPNTPTI